VCLSVSPGDRIVVTGPSGAGKSTLFAVLLRLARQSSGTITVGRTDLGALDLREWREQVAWVPQRPYLFPGTAAENIALGRRGADGDAIRAAARLAGAAGFIESWPAGYHTELGERAVRLSAGQRQQIALARAFLRDAPLLLLDEPAAHLDPASARRLGETLRAVPPGRTVIVITHGRGWAGATGRVVRLDAGRLLAPPGAGDRPAEAVLR
jgi:ABC-type bacteriocin/lantibiotic exporter with double-glycine peptidase domain